MLLSFNPFSYLFDKIDKAFSFISKFIIMIFELFVQFTNFVTFVTDFIQSFFLSCPPVFLNFFYLFLSVSLALFIWRLIP